jgi:hypothetical protein
MDLFGVPTIITFIQLYVLVIARLARRELVWINVTRQPTAEWIARRITEAFPWSEAPRYLIRDQDAIHGTAVTRRLRAMGIRDKPIAAGSPWQNGYETDRHDPTGMCRPHESCSVRHICAGSSSSLPPTIIKCGSSIAGQGCPTPSGDRAPRRHHITTYSRRPSSPLLPNLSFRHAHLSRPNRGGGSDPGDPWRGALAGVRHYALGPDFGTGGNYPGFRGSARAR